MYVVIHDPDYGFPAQIRAFLGQALRSFPAVAAATWSVIGIQAVVAFAILAGERLRKIVLVLGIGLHLGIATLMNVPTFGMAMIELLTIGAIMPIRPERASVPTDETSRRLSADEIADDRPPGQP